MPLDLDEMNTVARKFGVAEQQVRRDHLISHILAALARELPEDLVFIGGTALARSHLPDGRLSEDIDLVARVPRGPLARRLDALLPRAATRPVGRLSWDVPLSASSRQSAVLTGAGVSVRIQLLPDGHFAPWPTEWRDLDQRYSDPPAARLQVPTLAAFAAWKTATWAERGAPRDLWDLQALSRLGAVDDEAAELYRRLGPTNTLPETWVFERLPTREQWQTDLAGQTRLSLTAEDAAREVDRAWAKLRVR